MKSVLKNKIQLVVVGVIILLAVIGYVLTQGTAFSKTNSVLVKIEKEYVSGNLNADEAKDLQEKFQIVSEKARLKAQNDDYASYDLSALLQAHLTAVDVLMSREENPTLVDIREALAQRIIEIEAEIVGREVSPFLVEDAVNDLYDDIDRVVDQFRKADGEIDQRMFNEAQISIQQSIVALNEAQASIEARTEGNNASKAVLRARRLVKEAQYTVDLALLIKKYESK